MAFLSMPLNVYDSLLENMGVNMMAAMRALQRSAAHLFEKKFQPEIFVALTRSQSHAPIVSTAPAVYRTKHMRTPRFYALGRTSAPGPVW